jgi:lysophospholipase L1-like esterase
MKILKNIVVLFCGILILAGCADRSEINNPENIATGEANFSNFVSIGNSLTAGLQSSSLYETAQEYSFGNLIAKQVGVQFEQPIISDPGIGGRIEIKSLNPFSTKSQPLNAGSPKNLEYAGIYNNLGIPGASLKDLLFATNSQTATDNFNIFFDIILREQGTVLDLAMISEPTLLTLWIGNNDILGFATSGGTVPYTPGNTFSELYDQLCSALSTGGFPVILANIPRVRSIPFFTTIAPSVGLFIQEAKIQNPDINGLVFQTTESPFLGIASINDLLNNSILLTLQSSTAASFIGDTTGAYYNSSRLAIPVGVNTNLPFGLSLENPFPNKYVLDESEQFTVDLITTSYNNAIEIATLKYNFELINIHDFFNKISINGYTTNGVTFTSEYIFGGIFSLDGVHPSSQGYAIIANQFIEKINTAFNAEIPLINVANIPGSIELAKKVNFNKFGMPIFEADTFKSIFY